MLNKIMQAIGRRRIIDRVESEGLLPSLITLDNYTTDDLDDATQSTQNAQSIVSVITAKQMSPSRLVSSRSW